MEPKPNRKLWLTGVALTVFAGLLIAPMTRWIVVPQLTMQFSRGDGVNTLLNAMGVKNAAFPAPAARTVVAFSHAVDRHADSLPCRIAVVMMEADGSGRGNARVVSGLRALTSRFPDRPALCAAILIAETRDAVRVVRPEQNLLSTHPEPNADNSPPSRPEDLASYDNTAANGERVDPDNAFFPLMRAVGQFAGCRDAEALASVHRAAAKPRYEDYVWTESSGRDILWNDVYGKRTVIDRTALYASILFPHYARMRSVARLTAVKAMQAEQKGDAEAGYAIRTDMMRVGSLMRAQSRTVIGSLVGVALTSIQTGRPSGRRPPDTSKIGDPIAAMHVRLDAFCAYLHSIGHGETADWLRAETAAGVEVKAIAKGGSERSVFGGAEMSHLCAWWALGIMLFANALWMLILALAAKALVRFRLADRGIPEATICAIVGIAGGLLFLNASFQPVAALMTVFTNLAGNEGPAPIWRVLSWRVAGVGLSLAVPLLSLLVFGIVSAAHKVSVTTGILRGLNAVGLPIAYVLLLAYGCVIIGTARQEASANRSLDKLVLHEGRYYADLVGRKWPDAVKP